MRTHARTHRHFTFFTLLIDHSATAFQFLSILTISRVSPRRLWFSECVPWNRSISHVRTTNQKAGDGAQKSVPLTRLQVALYWNQLVPGSLYLPQICIQRFYVGSLKLVELGIFTPQKLANTTNQNFLFWETFSSPGPLPVDSDRKFENIFRSHFEHPTCSSEIVYVPVPRASATLPQYPSLLLTSDCVDGGECALMALLLSLGCSNSAWQLWSPQT